jgi:uroporphyrinogen-III decarboxylase
VNDSGRGRPQDVKAEVEWAMNTCRDKASLVFITSNTLVPDVPLENIQTLWETVLESRW